MGTSPLCKPKQGVIELKTHHGTIRVPDFMFKSHKKISGHDLITLKNDMSFEILPQYKQANRFMRELATIIQNPDLSREKLRNDAEISISRFFEKTKFEIKNAKIIIHSKNNKIDNIHLFNLEDSSVLLDKDNDDNVSVFNNKINLSIENIKK